MYTPASTNRGDLDQSLQAAAQAAAQINAQLAAEGKIQQNPSHSNSQQANGGLKKERKSKTGRKDLFHGEVEINNLPPRVRNLLTKGYIQEQIQWKSKAALCTKGRYVSPREKTSSEDRPLYICIQAVEKHAVDDAVRHIHEFIAEHTGSSPTPPVISPSLTPNHPPPQISFIRDKIYINLDNAPEGFKTVGRVLGQSGDNVNYIQTETGVNVSLQGKGVNPNSEEPLHLLLEHVEQAAIQSARSLALSLVGTLQQDFVQWQREQQALQQQQQQQLVYTFSQPAYYSGSPASGNFHYPAVAMLSYDVNNSLTQTAASTNDTSMHSRSSARNLQSNKRPSRFDYQQSSGFPSAGAGDSESTKRTKVSHHHPYS